jgi:hypothetical protein
LKNDKQIMGISIERVMKSDVSTMSCVLWFFMGIEMEFERLFIEFEGFPNRIWSVR